MRYFGGNSGYDGYSRSIRALNAMNEGKFPKTLFIQKYGLTPTSFAKLLELDLIYISEWHHTSKFGNKTDYYSWYNDDIKDYYLQHKEAILQKLRKGLLEEVALEFEEYNERKLEEERLWREDHEKEQRALKAKRDSLPIITEYIASNGVTVINKGGNEIPNYNFENWDAYRDGVKLSKRHGKGSRDFAFQEFRDFLIEREKSIL